MGAESYRVSIGAMQCMIDVNTIADSGSSRYLSTITLPSMDDLPDDVPDCGAPTTPVESVKHRISSPIQAKSTQGASPPTAKGEEVDEVTRANPLKQTESQTAIFNELGIATGDFIEAAKLDIKAAPAIVYVCMPMASCSICMWDSSNSMMCAGGQSGISILGSGLHRGQAGPWRGLEGLHQAPVR